MRQPVRVRTSFTRLMDSTEEVKRGVRKGWVEFGGGPSMHFEAYEVNTKACQLGATEESEARLGDLYTAINPDRPFQEVEWGGRQWVVVMFPFVR